MFKIDGKVYTAATVGTVLPGVTRRSCIELLKDWGYEVVEGKIAIADIMAAAREGKLEEVFGTGTAAVVSPVKELVWKGEHAYIGDGKIGPVTQKLYDTMTAVSYTHLDVYKRQRLGRKGATDEEVLAAAKLANCDEFVEKLPDKWLSLIHIWHWASSSCPP